MAILGYEYGQLRDEPLWKLIFFLPIGLGQIYCAIHFKIWEIIWNAPGFLLFGSPILFVAVLYNSWGICGLLECIRILRKK